MSAEQTIAHFSVVKTYSCFQLYIALYIASIHLSIHPFGCQQQDYKSVRNIAGHTHITTLPIVIESIFKGKRRKPAEEMPNSCRTSTDLWGHPTLHRNRLAEIIKRFLPAQLTFNTFAICKSCLFIRKAPIWTEKRQVNQRVLSGTAV